MKKLIFSNLFAMLLLQASAQPVAKADAQAMMIGEVQNTMTNEVNIINEYARWEYERRNFK